MPNNKFDPELLQIGWVLGAFKPEDWPDQAALALEHGFDGTALQQLAGLVSPTFRDLENLPDRAFTEMGLKVIDKEQAATALIARGLPRVNNAISVLVKSFPSFSDRWRKHVIKWRGESAGSYDAMNQLADFAIEDLYRRGKQSELRRFFNVLEEILTEADQDTRNLIALGFFEHLKNKAYRTYGTEVFEEHFGPKSRQMWDVLQKSWAV